LTQGGNVAVVFGGGRPAAWRGFPVRMPRHGCGEAAGAFSERGSAGVPPRQSSRHCVSPDRTRLQSSTVSDIKQFRVDFDPLVCSSMGLGYVSLAIRCLLRLHLTQ
jgi:hypothetical protein